MELFNERKETDMKRIFGIALFAALLLAASVANAQEEKKVRRNQLPAAVEKTVAAESQGATIKGFSREVEKGKTYYEAEMSINGRGKDILMDTKGHIVEVEEQVDMATLPQAVQDALTKAAGTGTIEMIESLTKNGKLVAYEGHVKRGKKRSEIQVGPNGEKLKKPE
jgi:hypothetical protein